MFTLIKFIFKFISVLAGLILLLIIFVLYRGGDDFRWVGKMTQELGRSIADFGDIADKALELRKKFMGNTGILNVSKSEDKKESNKTAPSQLKNVNKTESQQPVSFDSEEPKLDER